MHTNKLKEEMMILLLLIWLPMWNLIQGQTPLRTSALHLVEWRLPLPWQ